MKKKGLLAAALATILLAGLAIAVAAQPQGPPPGRGMHVMGMGPGGPGGFPFLRELELTDAQKEQVKNITESHRDEMQQVGTRVREAQRAMDAAAEATPLNEDAVRAKGTELAAALADSAILRAKVHAEITAILTPEQQTKLQELRKQMEQRMQERGLQRGLGQRRH